MRIDRWLFFARIFKTRSKAVRAVEKGLIYLNGNQIKKQSQLIKIGDGVIVKRSNKILQIRVAKFAIKRESYDLAKHMYEDTIEEILYGTNNGANNGKARDVLEENSSPRPDKKGRRALIELKKASNFFKK